jgi:AbrB family looped-hinge helix DNA binding protein
MAQITAKGQITIPAELRRKYGLLPGAEVQVVEKDGSSSSNWRMA